MKSHGIFLSLTAYLWVFLSIELPYVFWGGVKFIFIFKIFIVIQLQLSAFSPHPFIPPQPTLCLLMGAFKTFTFKVIIDRYIFIAILFFLTSSGRG